MIKKEKGAIVMFVKGLYPCQFTRRAIFAQDILPLRGDTKA